MGSPPAPTLPDYAGAGLHRVVPAVLGRHRRPPSWLPVPLVGAPQVVLLMLDGLGWHQLLARSELAPTLVAMEGGPMTTVVPSTTATALVSLATGATPAEHGMVGYRIRVGGNEVLNVLRWRTAAGDARVAFDPESLQVREPFAGTKPPVVTRAEFAETGFTGAHLAGVRMHGWRMPSTLISTVAALLQDGETFIYAYYDGIDKVAHEHGLGTAYDREVAAADRLVADLLAVLPPGAALLVVADHGQVDVGDAVVPVHPEVMESVALLSGEGRFRWLHARPGQQERLLEAATRRHADMAWVRTRDQAAAEGWFGGPLSGAVAGRLGDVVLAAHQPVAFLDPDDTGEIKLRSRHGSLTAAEMWVPLVAARA